MRISKRMTAGLLASMALAGAAIALALAGSATVASAGMKPGATVAVDGTLLPSEPNFPVLHGVSTDKSPWLLKKGTVRLRSNGELQVKIRGLIIPSLGTAGPVTTIQAALYCANETVAGGTSASFPLSESGDATIETTMTVPLLCLAPAVLITPNENPAVYISETGLGSY